MGAPVMAFCRIDDKEIRLREPVIASDALIIQDPTLLHQVDLFKGLHPAGYVLINSLRSFEQLGLGDFARGFHILDCKRRLRPISRRSMSVDRCPTPRCWVHSLPRPAKSS